jgi:catechol 2,3-dioxygenase-like lactoylglutathione lyase family enzyme
MAEPIRMEGLTLPVSDVVRSVAFYHDTLRFPVQLQRGTTFALIRIGEGTIGLLSQAISEAAAASAWTAEQRSALHLEFSTDNLDALYEELKARGVHFHEPPHDEPWERAMATYDPDGYTVEFAEGRRGSNQPRRRAEDA